MARQIRKKARQTKRFWRRQVFAPEASHRDERWPPALVKSAPGKKTLLQTNVRSLFDAFVNKKTPSLAVKQLNDKSDKRWVVQLMLLALTQPAEHHHAKSFRPCHFLQLSHVLGNPQASCNLMPLAGDLQCGTILATQRSNQSQGKVDDTEVTCR